MFIFKGKITEKLSSATKILKLLSDFLYLLINYDTWNKNSKKCLQKKPSVQQYCEPELYKLNTLLLTKKRISSSKKISAGQSYMMRAQVFKFSLKVTLGRSFFVKTVCLESFSSRSDYQSTFCHFLDKQLCMMRAKVFKLSLK